MTKNTLRRFRSEPQNRDSAPRRSQYPDAEAAADWRRPARLLRVVALSLLLMGLMPAAVCSAQPPGDEPNPKMLRCLTEATGSIRTDPAQVPAAEHGRNVTLHWNVQMPTGCSAVQAKVDGRPVEKSGSQAVPAVYSRSFSLAIAFGGARRSLATTRLTVALPRQVTISSNDMAPLLVQALGTEWTSVRVLGHVELNLSGRHDIEIARNVSLIGTRTPSTPGPLLFTDADTDILFNIMGNDDRTQANVRISGVRIRGRHFDDVVDINDGCCRGIVVNSKVGVTIDNNEIYGWHRAGIEVRDDRSAIAYPTNPHAVQIRNNYIHHNQQSDSFGYGVVTGPGAYALIERNLFDYNRHAIAADGHLVDNGTSGGGYLAYENLVLKNGGVHCNAVACGHTHQFDMHASNDCGADFNCGPAGEYLDISRNSFFYVNHNGFKLRGTPRLAAHVHDNVFAHEALFDETKTLPNGRPYWVWGALKQNETGLDQQRNRIKVYGIANLGTCDFDGDGTEDYFLATGQTWWFSSAKTHPWSYLNTSTRERSAVTLGYFDGDQRCDVSANGVIYPGGRTT